MTRLASALVIAAALAASPAAATRTTAQYTSLTVFGDSLVDAGNVSFFTGGATPDRNKGYVDGRYTNGYDYTDLLSQALYRQYTTPSLKGGRNFAFGDARIVANADMVPDLTAQVALRTTSGQAIDPNGLYVLTLGANDIFAAGRGDIGAAKSTDAYLRNAAGQYAAAVRTLNDAGARNILITDFPVAFNGDNDTANGYLKTALDGLTLNGATSLFRYDLAGFFRTAVLSPATYGLPPLNVTSNCVAAGAQPDCAGYFSFDGVHPTAAVQGALFRDANARFGLTAVQAAVPEPNSWALMIGGFGLVGGLLRRRRAPRVAAVAIA